MGFNDAKNAMMTPSAKNEDVEQIWYVANAEGKVLGRFASEVARILRGKHRPMFTPHMDLGDHVVIVNAEKIQVKGNNKPQQKVRIYAGAEHPHQAQNPQVLDV